jgi:hypothetical protein
LRNVVVGEVWISLGILGAALRWFSQVATSDTVRAEQSVKEWMVGQPVFRRTVTAHPFS